MPDTESPDRDPGLARRPAALGAALALLALTFVVACGGAGGRPQEEAGPDPRAVPVETAEVMLDTLRATITVTGTLRSIEQVELKSEITGPIEAVHFEEGRWVERGQLLITIDAGKLRRELGARRAALESAEARAELARRTHTRMATLRERGAISQEQLDEAETDLEQAGSDIRRLQEEIALIQERLDDTEVRAPMDGEISERLVDPGDFRQEGDPLATLYSTGLLEVAFGLPERVLERVELGQEVKVRSPAYPDRTFAGEVVFIDPGIDVPTRNLLVKSPIDNSEGLLKPGGFVSVEVTLERRDDATVVPERALVATRQGSFVFVVVDGVARRRDVTIGLRVPGRVEIREGVRAGETIVTGGQMNLADGAPVEVVEQALDPVELPR